MRRVTTLILGACLVPCLLAGAAEAKPGAKIANFKASISGNQVTTWVHDTPADGPCVGARTAPARRRCRTRAARRPS